MNFTLLSSQYKCDLSIDGITIEGVCTIEDNLVTSIKNGWIRTKIDEKDIHISFQGMRSEDDFILHANSLRLSIDVNELIKKYIAEIESQIKL